MPTSEERNTLVFLKDFFYPGRDALGCLKDKVEVLIAQYDQLRAIAGQGRLQDRVHAEQDITCYVTLQRRYLEVLARAEAALKKKLMGALKTWYRVRATHTMTQNSLESCPACGGTHTAMGSNNEKYVKTRLSNCEVFTRKSFNERATIIQKTRGCILCLDWTGSHQVGACQAKGRQGRTFDPCK